MSAFAIEHNSQATINEKLAVLNALSADWKRQFDEPPAIPLHFAVNARNKLTLDGIVICDIHQVQVTDAAYTGESLFLNACEAGHFYRIKIVWTFDETVYIDEVALVLYQAEKK